MNNIISMIVTAIVIISTICVMEFYSGSNSGVFIPAKNQVIIGLGVKAVNGIK
jgi:hypothetical protein